MSEEVMLFLNYYSIAAVSIIIIFKFLQWKIFDEAVVMMLINVLIYLANIYY